MVTKTGSAQLDRIKKNICRSRKYFEDNYKRYHEFKKFVFSSTMTKDDIATLKDLGKPQIEFNILESYISRLRGEFSKQEPSIKIKTKSNAEVDSKLLSVLEGYLRNIDSESRANGNAYKVYSDQLSGGFSAWKVWTEYENERSFKQILKYGRVYDPTMTGFDPLAREIHKGDGNYCFEIFPRTCEEFQNEYPNIDISKINFIRKGDIEGFSFSYEGEKGEKILLLVDYYEKKRKTEVIQELSDGRIMTTKEYKDFLVEQEESGSIEQTPTLVGKPRNATRITIEKYVLIEDQVIEDEKTDFRYLPLVFVDGNSETFRDIDGGEVKQMTRPYVYQAKGMQKLKNFAGQSLANELENSIQHKIMIAKEAISDDYIDPLVDIQHASVLVYNAFKDGDPNVPLPPPREIVRTPIPPEITNTFKMADETTQAILGSYDASLGINNNQLSGIAIVEGATQSNAAAMPYIVSYMQCYSQVCRILLDLTPKYIISPTNLSIIDEQGEPQSVPVNGQSDMKMKFNSQFLDVEVEAGVSFEIQKRKTLDQVISLMKISPKFSQIIDQTGLLVLVDNLDIRGVSRLKSLIKTFLDNEQNQPTPPNPAMLEQQNIQTQMQENQRQNEIKNHFTAADIAIKHEANVTNRIEVVGKLETDRNHHLLQQEKVSTEQAGQAVQLAVNFADKMRSHDREDRKEIKENQSHNQNTNE